MSAPQAPRRVAAPLPRRDDVPPPAAPPSCARCGHQGPAGAVGTLRGHRPVVGPVGVIEALACAVTGCSCRITPVAAEWWQP